MNSFKDLFSLKTATDKMNTFDLSCDSITTQDFFTPKVVYSKELVPKETTNINVESYIRLSPLIYPTFMRCTNKVRAFQVPYRSIWRGWNNFITTSETPTGSILDNVLRINNAQIVQGFLQYSDGSALGLLKPQESIANSDITVRNTDGSVNGYYSFTRRGRVLNDALIGLGYRICWDGINATYTTYVNALPLLALYKVLYDWYIVNQYNPVNEADALIQEIGYTSSISQLQLNKVLYCIAAARANYDNDYFTAAFNNPNGPSGGSNTAFSFVDPNFTTQTYQNIVKTQTDSSGSQIALNVPYINVRGKSVNAQSGDPAHVTSIISQYSIKALQALSDYMTRHQLAGSTVIERYASRFGIKLSNEKGNNKSIYLGSNEVAIKIGDVMNTTQSDDYQLGSFAGQGVGYGNNGNFKVSTDEYGIMIVLSDIVPHVGYSQGVKRHTLHLAPQDFYTPEFDGLGNQAIALKELALTTDCTNSSSICGGQSGETVFGFTPRYAEYKVAGDFMTGNYIYASSNAGEDAWYGTRMFNDSHKTDADRLDSNVAYAGSSFLNSDWDGQQYSRIFADNISTDVNPSNDHFRTIFHFDVKSTLPMSKLFDTYEFDSNGKDITMKVGGETLHN